MEEKTEKRGPGRPPKKMRKERIPLGGMKLKLSAPQRAGFERRWFNDNGNRIMDAMNAGYEFVHDGTTQEEMDEPKTRIHKVVGVLPNGHPMHAYLMETKEEFYKADQGTKAAAIDETEAAMRRGSTPGQSEQERRYIPEGRGISIQRG
jgi:hypothetical protein|tara:strand:- start:10739 stop:11185 length:447 start_codon:yes stop_codon:yes gene_type:complete